MESPDTIHGRMKEGAHLAGYSLQRSIENLRWLLEDSRFEELSNGYRNVNDFLRDTQGAFALVNVNPEERKQIAELIKELQPQASQRAIADMVGVSHPTIAGDLGGRDSGKKLPFIDVPPGEIEGESGKKLPPAIPPDDYNPVEREQKKQHREKNARDKEVAKSAPEPEAKQGDLLVERGDLWQLGRHLLLCGDAYNHDDMARLVDDVVVDALISDPPYGIDYRPDWRKWDGTPGDFQQVTGDDRPFDPVPFLNYPTVALFGANHFSHLLPPGGWLCWDKRTDEKKDAMFGSPFELAWFESANTTRRAIMIRLLHGGVVNADSENGNNEKRYVATQKPVRVMATVLHELTEPDDCILDPFAGSGSTLLAAESVGRSCLAMEIEPAMAAITLGRWAEMTGETPCKLE
jgi:DNA modification methylase